MKVINGTLYSARTPRLRERCRDYQYSPKLRKSSGAKLYLKLSEITDKRITKGRLNSPLWNKLVVLINVKDINIYFIIS